ncbi:hypothetical protein HispidOSU_023050 [Sigmodon hispidus]
MEKQMNERTKESSPLQAQGGLMTIMTSGYNLRLKAAALLEGKQRDAVLLRHQLSSHAPLRPNSLPRPLRHGRESKGFWEPA